MSLIWLHCLFPGILLSCHEDKIGGLDGSLPIDVWNEEWVEVEVDIGLGLDID